MNRGSETVASNLAENPDASMRPRFMNRGSLDSRRRGRRVGNAASMRPRFMNRGSTMTIDTGQIAPDRFNEAPIHESGKWMGT